MALTTTPSLGRAPSQLVGGWEAGLLVLIVLLYLGGAFVNPAFFGSTEAFHALLRDTSRVGIIAVGMTFVIVNKDLDLSVGSTYGLIAVVFARLFAPSFLDLGIVASVLLCLLLGALIGLINGVLVTILKVPAFIATLTILFIGRGFVLALTHGQSIYYPAKAAEYPLFFRLGETNALGFNNQIVIFAVVAVIGAYVLAKTRWGYETFATGGNEQAAIYAGIPTNWVRIRAYLISSLCAALAGLMSAAQDKGVTPLYGVSLELIVIAAVIIGGASILGGRGRVFGSCLGAMLVVLLDKVLREGWPITRIDQDRRRGDRGQRGLLAAGRRGAGLPRPAPDPRRADRALPHPPPGGRRASGPGSAAGRRRRPTRSAASPSRACRPRARWRPTWRCRRPASASSSPAATRSPSS